MSGSNFRCRAVGITVLSSVIASLLTSTSAFAQGGSVTSDFLTWNAASISGPLRKDGRFLVSLYGNARFRDNSSALGTTVIRPAIGWRVNPDLDVWVSYARVISRSEGRPDAEENRATQQANYRIPSPFGETLLGGRFSGRTRLEERLRSNGNDVGVRFRQLVRWTRPISQTDFSVYFGGEIFFNLNSADWGQRAGFDQNRVFTGMSYRLSPKARIDTGYLNIIVNGRGGADRVLHHLQMSLSFRL